MRAQFRAQVRAAGVALTAKRGGLDPRELRGPARAMYETMTKREIEEIASTPLEELPEDDEPLASH